MLRISELVLPPVPIKLEKLYPNPIPVLPSNQFESSNSGRFHVFSVLLSGMIHLAVEGHGIKVFSIGFS